MATLSNSLVSFTFDTDPTSGLKFSSFTRVGSAQTWVNHEEFLWKAKVYDTTATTPFTVADLLPTAATFGGAPVVSDDLGQEITAVWTSVPVGVDALTVTLVLRLNAIEDWLRVTVSAAWVGTPTRFTLDSIGCLGLEVEPLHQGSDFAAFSAVFGVLSEDPITNLRQSNGVSGFPNTFFNTQTDNRWAYPAGRGWTMPLWGYYENVTSEGWMLWCEDWSLELFYATFQSDGTNLTWSVLQPQPDNVLIGNNAQVLGSGYTFCLRPFQATSQHGWWDIARHYRERVELGRPEFYTPARRDRTDISDSEKNYSTFVEVLLGFAAPAPSDGEPVGLTTILDAVRTNSGAPTGTPISGIIEAPTFNLSDTAETANGDLHAMLAALYTAGQTFFGMWAPNTDSLWARVWPVEKRDNTLGDGGDLRWWTSADATGRFRMSRKGYLDGGGTDRLAEQAAGYYRERSYTITNWNAGSRTATVSGTPSADGFSGTTNVVLVPAVAGDTMALATVQTLGANTIVITVAGFVDGAGNVPVPVIGDGLTVFRFGTWEGGSNCVHAEVNSSYLARLTTNLTKGMADGFGNCGAYIDTATEMVLQSAAASRTHCYRDHSSWSKINGGYVRHPLGGGDWYRRAMRDWVLALKTAARDFQTANGRDPFYWMSCEDIDETMHDLYDWCWHTVSAGRLWRDTTGFDPTIHKYKTIPLYAVVYAGRTMGRGVNNELSSAILDAAFNDPDLFAFQAYCLASEWPYGLTWPTLGYYADDTIPLRNFFDDTLYVAGGGSVSNTVKAIRDLWKQISYAESNWLLDAGFRYGEMMPPAAVDFAVTSTTTGLAQSTWTAPAPFYHSYDTLYERAAFPRVTHGVWKKGVGEVLVLLVNWTDTAAAWSGAINTEVCGLGAAGSSDARRIVATRKDYTGAVSGSATFDSVTGTLTLASIPAFSVAAVSFTLGVGSMATIVKGTTFTSTVTAGGLHALVESATISGIERGSMDIDTVSVASLSTTELTGPSDNEVWQVSPGNLPLTYDSASGEFLPGLPTVVKYTLDSSSADVVAGNALMPIATSTLTDLRFTIATGASTAKVLAIALGPVSAGGIGFAVIAGPAKAKVTGTVNAGEGVKLSATAGVLQSAGAVGTAKGWEVCGTSTTADSGGLVWISLRR